MDDPLHRHQVLLSIYLGLYLLLIATRYARAIVIDDEYLISRNYVLPMLSYRIPLRTLSAITALPDSKNRAAGCQVWHDGKRLNLRAEEMILTRCAEPMLRYANVAQVLWWLRPDLAPQEPKPSTESEEPFTPVTDLTAEQIDRLLPAGALVPPSPAEILRGLPLIRQEWKAQLFSARLIALAASLCNIVFGVVLLGVSGAALEPVAFAHGPIFAATIFTGGCVLAWLSMRGSREYGSRFVASLITGLGLLVLAWGALHFETMMNGQSIETDYRLVSTTTAQYWQSSTPGLPRLERQFASHLPPGTIRHLTVHRGWLGLDLISQQDQAMLHGAPTP